MDIATEALLKFLADGRPWLSKAACNAPADPVQTQAGVPHPGRFFHHPALDFDGTEDTSLTVQEYMDSLGRPVQERAAETAMDGELISLPAMESLRDQVEVAALSTCASCPVLTQCREWSLNNQVAGVSGGMTEAQRLEIEGLSRDAREALHGDAERVAGDGRDWHDGQVNDARVAELTMAGWSSARIARELGADPRTIYRARARARHLGLLATPA